ncbi:hypothetical protein AB4Y89_19290 [Terriglobus sp. 2YAB30_2]|uniref:hypothetical protein n=1 Tax=unclassified Terriglobus TaxID=2628988 RepID=UPI003F9E5904
MVDLAIAYRIYPGVSSKPAAWSDDKLKLSQYCLWSFKKSLGSLRVKIWALLDACPPEYEALFRKYFSDEELIVVNLDAIGNFATFSMQIDLLLDQTEADLVYFAEDDYIYSPGALVEMVRFARENPDADFVTPYDHSDQYQLPTRFERHWIRASGDRHWRSSTSTCLTFLATKQALWRTRKVFHSYGRLNNDGSLWMSITQKLGLLNPFVYAADPQLRKLWCKAWFSGWRQILFGRSRRLWNPMPTLATHLESTCLAPLVDWESEFRRVEQQFAVENPDLVFEAERETL